MVELCRKVKGRNMGKTIFFYNVGIYKNNELTNLNFIDFLDSVSLVKWEDRVRKIDNDIVAIFPIIYNDLHREKRIIPFGKFRLNYKPYTGKLTNPQYKEIKDEVLEFVTLVYDSRYRTLAMDYSIYGAKKKLVEQYFSSFLPNEENEIWKIRLSEVINDFNENELKNSSQIRSVVITLDLSKNQFDFFKHNNENNKSILDLFDNVRKTSDEYEANIVKLEFGAFENKKSTMNKQSILMLLQSLNIDLDAIKNIKIRYKNNKEKMEDIDLKNIHTTLSVRVLENSNERNPAPEYLGNTVIDVFESFSSKLINSQIKFLQDSHNEIMPDICIKPRDINKIEVKL